ncbi:MAG TPA: AraC family transcriptional regulator, partial [Sphingobacteriaceae bacterium]
MKNLEIRKKDGFNGQKAIVLPNKVIQRCNKISLISNLYLTDVGFYPKAKFHYRHRITGISQHILIYCTDGEGWLELDGKHYQVEKGQFIIIPQNTPHKYGSSKRNPWSIYWLHFKGLLSGQFMELMSLKGTKFCRFIGCSDNRIKLFENIYGILERGYSEDNLVCVNLSLWYFLSSLCYPESSLLPYKYEDQDVIDRSIQFMRENLNKKLSLEELASQSLVSTSHYCALFKKKTGYPPLEYFNHIKI